MLTDDDIQFLAAVGREYVTVLALLATGVDHRRYERASEALKMLMTADEWARFRRVVTSLSLEHDYGYAEFLDKMDFSDALAVHRFWDLLGLAVDFFRNPSLYTVENNQLIQIV